MSIFQRNHIKQNELLNKLLSNKGSVLTKSNIAKKLGNKYLQQAVMHSEYAKVEWERRLNDKQWYQKPHGIIILMVTSGLIIYAIKMFITHFYINPS